MTTAQTPHQARTQATTDGARSTATEPAVFPIAKNPPQMHARSPTGDRIYGGYAAVVVPAGLGATGRGGRSGTVGYKATAAGYDVFEYEICDQHRQCDTAHTVIAVETGQ